MSSDENSVEMNDNTQDPEASVEKENSKKHDSNNNHNLHENDNDQQGLDPNEEIIPRSGPNPPDDENPIPDNNEQDMKEKSKEQIDALIEIARFLMGMKELFISIFSIIKVNQRLDVTTKTAQPVAYEIAPKLYSWAMKTFEYITIDVFKIDQLYSWHYLYGTSCYFYLLFFISIYGIKGSYLKLILTLLSSVMVLPLVAVFWLWYSQDNVIGVICLCIIYFLGLICLFIARLVDDYGCFYSICLYVSIILFPYYYIAIDEEFLCFDFSKIFLDIRAKSRTLNMAISIFLGVLIADLFFCAMLPNWPLRIVIIVLTALVYILIVVVFIIISTPSCRAHSKGKFKHLAEMPASFFEHMIMSIFLSIAPTLQLPSIGYFFEMITYSNFTYSLYHWPLYAFVWIFSVAYPLVLSVQLTIKSKKIQKTFEPFILRTYYDTASSIFSSMFSDYFLKYYYFSVFETLYGLLYAIFGNFESTPYQIVNIVLTILLLVLICVFRPYFFRSTLAIKIGETALVALNALLCLFVDQIPNWVIILLFVLSFISPVFAFVWYLLKDRKEDYIASKYMDEITYAPTKSQTIKVLKHNRDIFKKTIMRFSKVSHSHSAITDEEMEDLKNSLLPERKSDLEKFQAAVDSVPDGLCIEREYVLLNYLLINNSTDVNLFDHLEVYVPYFRVNNELFTYIFLKANDEEVKTIMMTELLIDDYVKSDIEKSMVDLSENTTYELMGPLLSGALFLCLIMIFNAKVV